MCKNASFNREKKNPSRSHSHFTVCKLVTLVHHLKPEFIGDHRTFHVFMSFPECIGEPYCGVIAFVDVKYLFCIFKQYFSFLPFLFPLQ